MSLILYNLQVKSCHRIMNQRCDMTGTGRAAEKGNKKQCYEGIRISEGKFMRIKDSIVLTLFYTAYRFLLCYGGGGGKLGSDGTLNS